MPYFFCPAASAFFHSDAHGAHRVLGPDPAWVRPTVSVRDPDWSPPLIEAPDPSWTPPLIIGPDPAWVRPVIVSLVVKPDVIVPKEGLAALPPEAFEVVRVPDENAEPPIIQYADPAAIPPLVDVPDPQAVHPLIEVPDMAVHAPMIEVDNPDCMIPAGAIEITDARHAELMQAQASGQRIVANEDGAPIAIDYPALSGDDLWAGVRARRDARLKETDWTQLPDVPEATRLAWVAYRQALRDITLQPDPAAIEWPPVPDLSVVPSEIPS